MTAIELVEGHCSDPAVFQALTSYAFGDLDAAAREKVHKHVLECGRCARELERLTSCVLALRHDPLLPPLRPTRDVLSVLSFSGRLDQPFGGHSRFVVAGASLFAFLQALPVVVEVAYEFDRLGRVAITLALVAFAWMLGGTLLGLWQDVKIVRNGVGGLGRPLATWATMAAMLCLAMLWILPSSPTLIASFGTWPANLGYLKSMFYAWLVGPIFLLWPFHFVLVIQRELGLGHHQAVLKLLTGDKAVVPPRGTIQAPVWGLAVFLSGLVVLNYVGVNHLFAGLLPGAYANLFRVLVLVRVAAWLLMATLGLWWYIGCLNELKREALLGDRLLGGNSR